MWSAHRTPILFSQWVWTEPVWDEEDTKIYPRRLRTGLDRGRSFLLIAKMRQRIHF